MSSRLHWSIQEQNLILSMRQSQNVRSWVEIANEVNRLNNVKVKRTPKQCRDRYINFIRFGGGDSGTKGEQIIDLKMFIVKFLEYGYKWSKIAEFFPMISENTLKNKINAVFKKIMARINIIFVQNKKRKLKDSFLKECLYRAWRNLGLVDHFQGVNRILSVFGHFLEIGTSLLHQQQIPEEKVHSFLNQLLKYYHSGQIDEKTQNITVPQGQIEKLHTLKGSQYIEEYLNGYTVSKQGKKYPQKIKFLHDTQALLKSGKRGTLQNSLKAGQKEKILLELQEEICKFLQEQQLPIITVSQRCKASIIPQNSDDFSEQLRVIGGINYGQQFPFMSI